MAQMSAFQWLDKSGRPLLRIAGVVLCLAIGSAIAFAFWRSALCGVSVPDMSGGLLLALVNQLGNITDLVTRNRERVAEIQSYEFNRTNR